jgi:hypothetical protein
LAYTAIASLALSSSPSQAYVRFTARARAHAGPLRVLAKDVARRCGVAATTRAGDGGSCWLYGAGARTHRPPHPLPPPAAFPLSPACRVCRMRCRIRYAPSSPPSACSPLAHTVCRTRRQRTVCSVRRCAHAHMHPRVCAMRDCSEERVCGVRVRASALWHSHSLVVRTGTHAPDVRHVRLCCQGVATPAHTGTHAHTHTHKNSHTHTLTHAHTHTHARTNTLHRCLLVGSFRRQHTPRAHTAHADCNSRRPPAQPRLRRIPPARCVSPVRQGMHVLCSVEPGAATRVRAAGACVQ